MTGSEGLGGKTPETGTHSFSEPAFTTHALIRYLIAQPPHTMSGETKRQRLFLGEVSTYHGSHELFFPAFVDFVVGAARARAEAHGATSTEWVNSPGFADRLDTVKAMRHADLRDLRSVAISRLDKPGTSSANFLKLLQPYQERSEAFGAITATYRSLRDEAHFEASEILADVGYALAAMIDQDQAATPPTAPQTAGTPDASAA